MLCFDPQTDHIVSRRTYHRRGPGFQKGILGNAQQAQRAGYHYLVSTPYMDEASLCDRIALIQGGKILSIDTPQNIVRHSLTGLFAVKANEMYPLLKVLESTPPD
jgi:hypothetical protein